MKTNLFLIETLTNLHVGSGDINFDIIDNQVQKNSANIPIIHSSSLKGAFREHFEKKGGYFIDYIFGGSGEKEQAGAYSFFEAKLLTRPVRSNVKPYFNATTPEIVKDLIDLIKTFNIKTDFNEGLEKFYENIKDIEQITIIGNYKNVIIEDEEAVSKDIEVGIEFLNDLVIFPFEKFKKLDLPVIARNKLNNGKSVNLWYEEVVPTKSKFYFVIVKPDESEIDKSDLEKIKEFDEVFLNEGEIVQIGANKSIGYGFCKIKGLNNE